MIPFKLPYADADLF